MQQNTPGFRTYKNIENLGFVTLLKLLNRADTTAGTLFSHIHRIVKLYESSQEASNPRPNSGREFPPSVLLQRARLGRQWRPSNRVCRKMLCLWQAFRRELVNEISKMPRYHTDERMHECMNRSSYKFKLCVLGMAEVGVCKCRTCNCQVYYRYHQL